jgi:hypothetical protein
MALMLGKLPATQSIDDFRLEQVVDVTVVLPKIPKTFGHEKGFPLEMLGNGPDDSVRPGFEGAGDCVFAGACEETHLVEHAAGRPLAPLTGKQAIAAYSAVTGYVLGDAATDKGTDVRTALTWRRKTGIADAKGKRHRIGAFLALEPGNTQHLLAALYVFGTVGIGFQFPTYAMQQFSELKPWSYQKGGTIDGGHYVPAVARRTSSTLSTISWARDQRMTEDFFAHYCDEAWAIVPTEYLKAGGTSPEGFDQAQLNALLAQLEPV